MERRIKEINRFTVGWTGYFAFAVTILPFEKLRSGCAAAQTGALKEWKRPQTRYRNLRALGSPTTTPAHGRRRRRATGAAPGSWPLQRALPNAYWHQTAGRQGSPTPTAVSGNLSEQPACGPACRVVREGPGQAWPLPDCASAEASHSPRRLTRDPAQRRGPALLSRHDAHAGAASSGVIADRSSQPASFGPVKPLDPGLLVGSAPFAGRWAIRR